MHSMTTVICMAASMNICVDLVSHNKGAARSTVWRILIFLCSLTPIHHLRIYENRIDKMEIKRTPSFMRVVALLYNTCVRIAKGLFKCTWSLEMSAAIYVSSPKHFLFRVRVSLIYKCWLREFFYAIVWMWSNTSNYMQFRTIIWLQRMQFFSCSLKILFWMHVHFPR